MHAALFYRPGDRLSLTELTAARLDGHVVELGEGFVPADTVEGVDARATGLAPLVCEGVALCGPTAAWVHGAGDRPPAVHHVQRFSVRRGRVHSTAHLVYHERALDAEEVQRIAGVAVTRPLHTALTLLLDAARTGEEPRWLSALLLVRPDLWDALGERLAGLHRRPGRRAAETLFRGLSERSGRQDVVTR